MGLRLPFPPETSDGVSLFKPKNPIGIMNNLNQTFCQIIQQTQAKSSGSGGQYSGICPAHDDQSPSLSCTLNGERILLNCHAGCTFDDICQS
ncbi:uncharacterized protein METZ01_LOCUS199310, partial [marine metagenome]